MGRSETDPFKPVEVSVNSATVRDEHAGPGEADDNSQTHSVRAALHVPARLGLMRSHVRQAQRTPFKTVFEGN